MTKFAVELTITALLFMLENKLTGLEVLLLCLADKLELALEDISFQLHEVKQGIHKTRIITDATQG